jgi:deazaflavin-dependent oxidoreductase (nitroreductase family)
MAETVPSFRQPGSLERLFNRLFGILVGLGFGLSHNYLLQVRGRKTGRMYSTPVNLLVVDGRKYLIAPRGNTQWVRNARSGGEVWLKKGPRRDRFRVREVRDAEKPRLLKLYLEQFRTTVQRYFSVPAGSDAEAFAAVISLYPVFELEAMPVSPPPDEAMEPSR